MIAGAAPHLAILGGAPAFPETLQVGLPNLGSQERYLDYVREIWSSRRVTNDGCLVREFERRIAAQLGVQNAIAVCNGTAGLELLIRALGLSGEVIVPAFTFIATVHALSLQGIQPVFVDVDPDTQTIDPALVAERITPRTTGILGVHVWGNACRIEELEALARANRIRLLFDAAHAFACEYGGRMIGGFGEAEVFSFHATKFVHCGEGGVITTNCDELAARLRLSRNFGFSNYDCVDSIGTNAKMSELHAAMGLVSLDSLDKFLRVNRRNLEAYHDALQGLPGIHLARPPEEAQHNRQYVVCQVDPQSCPLTRDEILQVLLADGVFARRYFYPGCHRSKPYASLHDDANALVVTDRLCSSIFQLPTGDCVTPEQIQRIGRIIAIALDSAPEVRQSIFHRSATKTPGHSDG